MDKRTDEFGLLQQWCDAIYEEALSVTCDRRIGPYPCCSVVQGDCLELMKAIPNGAVDAVITDPPYGIGLDTDYSRPSKNSRTYAPIIGDDKPFDPSPFLGYERAVLFGANHYADKLPTSRGWIVWDKVTRNDVQAGQISDCEMAWTNCLPRARVFRHMWNGAFRDSERGTHYHPTQKPVLLMEWLLALLPDAQTVLDPFCGSGTTLVAAKKLGRHFLGFDVSEEYCQIARDRLARIDAQPSLFDPKPEQMVLG